MKGITRFECGWTDGEDHADIAITREDGQILSFTVPITFYFDVAQIDLNETVEGQVYSCLLVKNLRDKLPSSDGWHEVENPLREWSQLTNREQRIIEAACLDQGFVIESRPNHYENLRDNLLIVEHQFVAAGEDKTVPVWRVTKRGEWLYISSMSTNQRFSFYGREIGIVE